jgi:hypothetical protein
MNKKKEPGQMNSKEENSSAYYLKNDFDIFIIIIFVVVCKKMNKEQELFVYLQIELKGTAFILRRLSNYFLCWREMSMNS